MNIKKMKRLISFANGQSVMAWIYLFNHGVQSLALARL